MKKLMLALAFVAFAAPLLADTIIFTDQLDISGPNVLVAGVDGDRIKVLVPTGAIYPPSARIERVIIDYVRRRNALLEQEGPAPSLYDLGRVLDHFGEAPQAAEAFDIAVHSQPHLGDRLLAIGDFFVKYERWREARDAYQTFLERNPTQKEIAALLEEVSARVPADAAPYSAPTTAAAVEPRTTDNGPEVAVGPDTGGEPIAVDPVVDNGEKDPPAPAAGDGLESEDGWVIEQWGNEGTVAIEDEPDTGNRMLRVDFSSNNKNKVAARRALRVFDLSGYAALVCNVYNSADKPISLAVAFNTFPGWRFFESPTQLLRAKVWQENMVFDLTGTSFKCQETNWRHESKLDGNTNVRQLFLLIYNAIPEGSVFLDNVRFVTAEELKAIKGQ